VHRLEIHIANDNLKTFIGHGTAHMLACLLGKDYAVTANQLLKISGLKIGVFMRLWKSDYRFNSCCSFPFLSTVGDVCKKAQLLRFLLQTINK